MRHCILVEKRVGLSLIGGGRLCCLGLSPNQESLMLPRGEEEQFVLPDRSPEGKANVLVAGCSLAAFKRVGSLEKLVVVVIVSRSVQRIGARLDGQVCGATRISAQFR